MSELGTGTIADSRSTYVVNVVNLRHPKGNMNESRWLLTSSLPLEKNFHLYGNHLGHTNH
jgi:hypothetical protein